MTEQEQAMAMTPEEAKLSDGRVADAIGYHLTAIEKWVVMAEANEGIKPLSFAFEQIKRSIYWARQSLSGAPGHQPELQQFAIPELPRSAAHVVAALQKQLGGHVQTFIDAAPPAFRAELAAGRIPEISCYRNEAGDYTVYGKIGEQRHDITVGEFQQQRFD